MRNKNKKLTTKDICIIIPTYNRPKDIDRTLSLLIKNKNIPGKIIIIDQSKDDKTRKVVEEYKKKLPIDYIFSNIPSSSISVNLTIDKLKKEGWKYDFLVTLADDVDLLEGYFDEIIRIFKNPRIMAIGGAESKQEKYNFIKIKNKLSNFFLRIFFLPYKKDHKFKITGPYGHTGSPEIKKPINDAEWIPGFNTCFRKKIFEWYKMPDIIGYNVLEDIDISHSVYKKYGKGSLVISPKAKAHHRYSNVARYNEKKRIFVNHEDHFSFYYKYYHNFFGTLKMLWSLFGLILGNIFRVFIKPNKVNFLNLKYNVQGILYSYKNKENIKKKKYRLFLNDDLSMKEFDTKLCF